MSQMEPRCHWQFQKATQQEDEEHTEAKSPAGKRPSDLQCIQRQWVTLADVSWRLPWCHCIPDYEKGDQMLSLIKCCLLIVFFQAVNCSSCWGNTSEIQCSGDLVLDLNAAQCFDKSGNNQLKDDPVAIPNGGDVTKHTGEPAWMCSFGLRKGFYTYIVSLISQLRSQLCYLEKTTRQRAAKKCVFSCLSEDVEIWLSQLRW